MAQNSNSDTSTEPTEDIGSMHHVADLDDFEDAKRVIVEVEGREIAIFQEDEEFHALLNFCVHQGGPVCEGAVTGTLEADEDGDLVYNEDNKTVACPWHGWQFDIEDGKHTAESRYKIPTYSVVVQNGRIYLG